MNRRSALSGMGLLLGGTALGLNRSLPIVETKQTKDDFPTARKIKDLSGSWKFQVDIKDIGEKEQWFEQPHAACDWGKVNVPGAWDCYDEGLWQYEGVAWYKIAIQPEDFEPGKINTIHFGRVMQYSKVWLNGEFIGENIGGYLPFDFNISASLKPHSINTLTVRVDNRPRLEWLPAARDIEWIQYGGILDKVTLTGVAETFIEDVTVVTEIQKNTALITCKVNTVNQSKEAIKIDLEVEIFKSESVARKIIKLKLEAESSLEYTVIFNVENAVLWSPDSPTLYSAVLSLKRSNIVIDNIKERFGIRQVSVEGTTILLNGKPLYIKGINRYDDYGKMGTTVPEHILRKELALMKSAGINLIRVHYPQSPDLISLYDEFGFLMMEELPLTWWGGKNDPQKMDLLKYAKPDLAKLIKRDKNHPSIIIWSMCNECITTSEIGINVLSDLLMQSKSLDPTRLATYVLNGYEDPVKSKAYDKADVIVINKYYGTLQGEVCSHISDIEELAYKPFVSAMSKHRTDMPGKPMFMGEFGTQGIKNLTGDVYYSEDFQAAYIKRIWDGVKEIKGLSGGILWCWADYYHRKYYINYNAFGPYGVVTTNREPKKSFQTLKIMFNTQNT